MPNDIYAIITDRIITMLEKGTVPWQRPWRTRNIDGSLRMPRNLTTGRDYRGINVFLLGSAGFASSDWMTYRQAQAMGAQVRAGEQGLPVVFFKPIDDRTADDSDTESTSKAARLVVRYYTVFNRIQIDGLPAEEPASVDPVPAFEAIPACETLVQRMPNSPTIQHGAARACYMPMADRVNMPSRDLFNSPEEYYSTLFHELVHATGHGNRLARSGITDICAFGSTNYSKEELIAEMGATFLCAMTGIDNRTIDNSAAYLNGWIVKLKNDRRILVQAGAAAQKAVDYLTI